MLRFLPATIAVVSAAARCPITADTNILVYRDTTDATHVGGTGHFSSQWETKFWAWFRENSNLEVNVTFTTAAEFALCDSLSAHPKLWAWVQPGGNAYEQSLALGAKGKEMIVEFVESGGLYIGTCAGWYYAVPGYYWEWGRNFSDSGFWTHPTLLGLFPYYVEGSIDAIQDMELAEGNFHGNKTTDVSALTTHGFSGLWGVRQHRALYYGGPTLGYSDLTYAALPPGAEALGVFAAIPGRCEIATKRLVSP